MNNPQISVVLPVYNAEVFLAEAISSILKQSIADFELLIINDGSTDQSSEIINRFQDKRIRILNNSKNEGLIASLNKGISEAKGEFIARMDADDTAQPKRFEEQLKFLIKHPNVGVCGTLMHMIHNKKDYAHRYLESDLIKSSLLFTNPIVHPSVMMRKSIFKGEQTGYDKNFVHGEDYALWISFIPKTDFGVVDIPLLNYRAHENQVSRLFNSTQIDSVKKAQEFFFSYLKIQPSQEEKELHTTLFLERYEKSESYISAVESWLTKLSDANRETQFFNEESFKNIVGEWWFRVNRELSASGIGSYQRFKSSIISGNYKPSANLIARLKVKSILKREKGNKK